MCAVCERDNVWCECSPPLLSWDVRWHCWPYRSRPSSAPLPLFPPSGLMVIEGLTAAPALLQGACSYSAAFTLILRTTQSNLGQVGSREREFWNLRCAISAIGRSDSSNLFCCSWAATRFVWCRDSWPHVLIGQDHSREPQFVSCRWCLPCVHGVTPHVCFLQVESLIENEAEKDYLYDVLRIYHQWVLILTAWL